MLLTAAAIELCLIITYTLTSEVVGQESTECTFPNGERAMCRPLSECKQLRNLFSRKQEDVIYLLSKFQCGKGDRTVCCPENDIQTAESSNFITSCNDPLGRKGSCVPIRQCQSAIYLLVNHRTDKRVVEFLRDAVCGFHDSQPKVCCKDGFQPTVPTKPPPGYTEPPAMNKRKTTTTTEKPLPTKNSIVGILGVECGTRDDNERNNNRALKEPRVLPDEKKRVISDPDFYKIRNPTKRENPNQAEWPWMVALRHSVRGNIEFFCGGSLITNQHVLTAAHCFLRHSNNVMARLGDFNLMSDADGATPIDMKVTKISLHPEYSPYNFTNDIAILMLERPIKFTNFIRAICLPTMVDSPISELLQIAGWGADMLKGPISPILQDAVVELEDPETCKRKIRRVSPQAVIDDRVLCAGNMKPDSSDTCKGDSGGPIMDGFDVFYQVGIVSYGGNDCEQTGLPTVFTKTAAYIDWIVDTVRSMRL